MKISSQILYRPKYFKERISKIFQIRRMNIPSEFRQRAFKTGDHGDFEPFRLVSSRLSPSSFKQNKFDQEQ